MLTSVTVSTVELMEKLNTMQCEDLYTFVLPSHCSTFRWIVQVLIQLWVGLHGDLFAVSSPCCLSPFHVFILLLILFRSNVFIISDYKGIIHKFHTKTQLNIYVLCTGHIIVYKYNCVYTLLLVLTTLYHLLEVFKYLLAITQYLDFQYVQWQETNTPFPSGGYKPPETTCSSKSTIYLIPL